MTASSASKESYFEVPASVVLNLEESLLAITRQNYLKRPERRFFEALLSCASRLHHENPEDLIQIRLSEFSDYLKKNKLPSTRQTITTKGKMFTEYGFLHTSSLRQKSGGRPCTRYTVESIYEQNWQSSIEQSHKEKAGGRTGASSSETNSKRLIQFLQKSNAQYLTTIARSRAVSDGFFCGMLDRAMRFNLAEEIEDNIITVRIPLGSVSTFIIQATTLTGRSSEIAALQDQRTIRAVISEVVQSIQDKVDRIEDEMLNASMKNDLFMGKSDYSYDQQNGQFKVSPQVPGQTKARPEDFIENRFFIDVVNLAKRMDYQSPHSGATRLAVNKSLRRLSESNFRITIKNPHTDIAKDIMQHFGLPDSSMDLRFITDLKSQMQRGFYEHRTFEEAKQQELDDSWGLSINEDNMSDEELVDPYREDLLRSIRVWSISIDSYLFDRLRDREARAVFAAHKEIMKERSGLAQSLYNILNSLIGRSNQKLRGAEERRLKKTLVELHTLLWPTRHFHQFEEHFLNLLKRYHEKPEEFMATVRKANKRHRTVPIRPEIIRMFGYVFLLEIRDKQWAVTIYRDTNDPLNGDQSYHNRQLEKAARKQRLQA